MRQTFTELINTTKDYISKDTGSFAVSTVDNFVKNHLNKRYSVATATLRDYKTQWPSRTAVTVSGQQFYYNPPDLQSIESVTLTIGGVIYPLQVINNANDWNMLNQVTFSGTAIPQYVFPRRDDFGLWPIPQSDGDTITMIGNLQDRAMTADDYSTGDVDVTQNSRTVTGNGTTFVSGMIGRWLKVTGGDNRWYRIATFVTATELTLETYYEGLSVASASYVIGEQPEIPDDIHDILPHGAAAEFYAGPAKDFVAAQGHNNYFWTGDFNNNRRSLTNARGGLLGAVNRYTNRSNSSIVNKNIGQFNLFQDRWVSTLTE